MDVIEEHLTPAGSKIVRVIAADKILADFARILSLLKGAESSSHCNQMSVDLIPVEHLLIDINPETAKFM